MQQVDVLVPTFFDWQSDMVCSVARNGGCLPRALVWRPDSGLGNRVQQFAAAVNYAALTSRVLLVDWKVRLVRCFVREAARPTRTPQHPGSFERYFTGLPTREYRADKLGLLLCKSRVLAIHPGDEEVIPREIMGCFLCPLGVSLLAHFTALDEQTECWSVGTRRSRPSWTSSTTPPWTTPSVLCSSTTASQTAAWTAHPCQSPFSFLLLAPALPDPSVSRHSKRMLLQPSDLLQDTMRPTLERMRGALVVGLQLRSEYLNFGQDQLFFRCFEEIAEAHPRQRVLMFLTTESQEIADNFRSLMDPERIVYLNKTIVHTGEGFSLLFFLSRRRKEGRGVPCPQTWIPSQKTRCPWTRRWPTSFSSRTATWSSTRTAPPLGGKRHSLGGLVAWLVPPSLHDFPHRAFHPRSSNMSMSMHSLGNRACQHTESACDDFELPKVCPHARERLQGGWRTFTGFEGQFVPSWKDTGGERRPPPALSDDSQRAGQ